MVPGQDVVDRERDRQREYQQSFGGNFGGSGNLIEQRVIELRSMTNSFSSPTAREICQHATALLEAAWLIEKQGGVTTSQDTERYRTQQTR